MNLITQKIELPAAYSVTTEAQVSRSDMVRRSQSITTVSDSREQEQAALMGSELQTYIKSVSEMRKSLTRPFDEATAKLITLERDHVSPLLVEKERLGRLVTDFQRAEVLRVAEEERKRAEEFQRLEADRKALQDKADKAAAKGQEAKQMKAELAAYQTEQAQREMITAPLPVAAKAKGAATKQTLCYEVTDITALHKARPELCSVSEKASAIKAVCFAKEGATRLSPDTSIPGLKLWNEEVTSFRRAK